jgi:orotate phosphoribosyltransferase
MMKTDRKWECQICGCKSDAIQESCPNGCEFEEENEMSSRDQLLELIRDKALKRGHFKMASGATSDIMLDLSKALRTEAAQQFIAVCVKDLLPNMIQIGGPISGSDLVCSAIARSGKADRWFGVRNDPKGRGYDVGKITGNLREGDSVWLIEDVCTSGGTLRRAAQAVHEFGATVEGVFAVVNRGGLDEVAKELGVPCKFIFDLEEISG